MKYLLSTLFILCFCAMAISQVPQSFTYQAVATDDTGAELINQQVSMRAIVVKSTPNGEQQWIERHNFITDEFGLFVIEIGNGFPEGGAQTSFSNIDWGADRYFLRVEMDPTGGNDYQFVGAKQLLSVPYALYAEKAKNAVVAGTATDDLDRDPDNEIQELTLSGSELGLSGGTEKVDLSDLPFDINDADADPANELQELTLSGSELGLSGGTEKVDLSDLPFDINDADADPANELQDLILSGGQLSLTGSGSSVSLNNLPINVNDADSNPTNEMQELILEGALLALTGNGSTVDLSYLPINIEDADANPYNELQDLSINNGKLSLSGSSVTIDLGSLPIEDADADPSNELQEIFAVGGDLGITGGNTISLNDIFSGAGSFNDPGATIDFPQGVTNAKYIFAQDLYTVPSGKTFYITAAEDEVIFTGVGQEYGRHITGPSMPIIGSGQQIDNCRCVGFLKDGSQEVIPELIVLEPSSQNSYTVPSNKGLVVKSGLEATSTIFFNGHIVNFFGSTLKSLVIPEGVTMDNHGNDEIIITGYLIDNN